MRTGHYPTYQHYLRTATRKDDRQWQFDLGLNCLLDGISARLVRAPAWGLKRKATAREKLRDDGGYLATQRS
ncbi:hypothetical protein ACTMTF_47405 [Nonomuraea sp. ZG12]|uniref:hypothetical protein n=1 Tax=Nonomuraea sp. ZG12 TaxID=3452207 RepID=UPI003F89874D